MNNTKNITIKTLVFCLLVTCIISCKKKTDEPSPSSGTQPTGPTGTFYFHLHTYVDDITEVDGYNIVYTRDDGRKISVSEAQLYLSNIQLVKSDGSLYSIPDTIILKTLEYESYLVANVPVGQYKSVRFKVGIDSVTNSKAPSASSPAILKDSSMWFTNTAQQNNFVFVNFQGKIDTTTNASGTEAQMQAFSYKMGTDANYKQVSMPNQNYTVVNGQTTFVHIIIDYSQLFNGVKLSDPSNLSISTILDNGTALGTKIANNIPSMFSYEQL